MERDGRMIVGVPDPSLLGWTRPADDSEVRR